MHIVAAPGGETPVNIANRYNNHCDQLGHKSGLQNVPIRALASELDHRTILKPNHRGQHWNHFLTLYNNGLPLFSVDTMIPLFEYSLPLILNWIPAPSFSASQCLLSFRVIPGAGGRRVNGTGADGRARRGDARTSHSASVEETRGCVTPCWRVPRNPGGHCPAEAAPPSFPFF